MSQNAWATILPFGPVTLIFTGPKKKFRAWPSFQALTDMENMEESQVE
jgi:hypothetical protein